MAPSDSGIVGRRGSIARRAPDHAATLRATGVNIAVHALDRMLALARPIPVRLA